MKSSVSYIPVLIAFVLCLTACTKAKQERDAQARLSSAEQMVNQQRYEAALMQLDSVHALYPKLVPQRRIAKALQDSIRYLQAQHTLLYADSLLQPLLPEADKLLKEFRYEKNDSYEDHGHYVYRTLQTGWNTSRNFLQAYVADDRQTLVKSYYCGTKAIRQNSIALRCGEEEIVINGQNHAFEVEGWHEILTISDDPALEVLNFISAHLDQRIAVSAIGDKGRAIYYLADSEKQALDKTYQLGLLMHDINQLEQQISLASKRIDHYENKTN